jgi:hypothetical protein
MLYIYYMRIQVFTAVRITLCHTQDGNTVHGSPYETLVVPWNLSEIISYPDGLLLSLQKNARSVP